MSESDLQPAPVVPGGAQGAAEVVAEVVFHGTVTVASIRLRLRPCADR